MNTGMKKELFEYLVRSCVREVITQVKEAAPEASKSDFYTDSQGSWCKWCGSKAVDVGGVKKCKNTTCKLNRHKKNPSVREVDEPTKGAPTPPEYGLGAGENVAIPKEKDTTPEPPSEPETPETSQTPKGICFVNPRKTSELIKLFQEPEAPKSKVKPGRKPKSAEAPPTTPAPPTSEPQSSPPITEAVSPMAAYSHIPPKQLTRDMIERIVYYIGSKFAGTGNAFKGVANSTLRDVEKAIKSGSTLFLYLGKLDPASDEIFVLHDESLQGAKANSIPPSELGGAGILSPSPGSADFDPETATADDMAQFMDKEAPGKVRTYGAPEDPEDLGDVDEKKLYEVKRMIKKLVSEVLDR
jgi:hypothetical protein